MADRDPAWAFQHLAERDRKVRSRHRMRRVKVGAVAVVAAAAWVATHPSELAYVGVHTPHGSPPISAPVPPHGNSHQPPKPVIAPPAASTHLAPIDLGAAVAGAPTQNSQVTPLPKTGPASVPITDPVFADAGGPVQTSPQIYVLFLGPDWATADTATTTARDSLLAFYARLDGSKYADGLTQYRGAGAHPHLVAAWVDSRPITDGGDPATAVADFVAAANIPAGNETSVVVVYPAGTSFATRDGKAAGYHTYGSVPYTVLSWEAGFPASLTDAASHEFTEGVSDVLGAPDNPTQTNPAISFGTKSPFSEVADVCETQKPVLSHGIALALYYDARTGACVAPSLGD